jgi:hypothetical protein
MAANVTRSATAIKETWVCALRESPSIDHSNARHARMAHRDFVDSHGTRWEVWSVLPEYAERRRGKESDDMPAVERRERAEFRVPLGGQWADGWLCFESNVEKRRLAPVPDEWSEMSVEDLEKLCQTATPTRTPPRRLIE